MVPVACQCGPSDRVVAYIKFGGGRQAHRRRCNHARAQLGACLKLCLGFPQLLLLAHQCLLLGVEPVLLHAHAAGGGNVDDVVDLNCPLVDRNGRHLGV